MRKVSEKERRANIARSKKVNRTLYKRNRRKRKKNKKPIKHFMAKKRRSKRKAKKQYNLTPPITLSALKNTEETLEFFQKVFDTIRRCEYGDRIYFVLRDVQQISTDAIMYLIAIMRNTKRVRSIRIQCVGNNPLNMVAQRIIVDSGFYDYVQSPMYKKAPHTAEKIQITEGTGVNTKVCKQVCDYVQSHTGKGIKSTTRLYATLIELMTNTKQHAYTGIQDMDDSWYIFVDSTDKFVSCTFLDTGAGIPATVKKKLFERVASSIGFEKDAYYIASALHGELRSETGKAYRGKGLPGIYEDATANNFMDLIIISGAGMCMIKNDDSSSTIKQLKLRNEFKGTLFNWKLMR